MFVGSNPTLTSITGMLYGKSTNISIPMQVWIFFAPGMGGDGFANLLEQSLDITPIDSVTDYWRVHRIVDGQVKFYAPTPDQNQCLRLALQPFDHNRNQLYQNYVDLVAANKNCVISSHDLTLDRLAASDQKSILCKDQIKVLLTGDYEQARQNAATKNLYPEVSQIIDQKQIDPSKFDLVIDIRDVQKDWQAIKSFCDEINIRLDQKKYHEYRSLLLGHTVYMSKNYDVEIYQSTRHNGRISYQLIDVWQPTA